MARYGPESQAAIEKTILLRNKLYPYIMAQMATASETGQPVNRPLFWDFPSDPQSWRIKVSQKLFLVVVLVCLCVRLRESVCVYMTHTEGASRLMVRSPISNETSSRFL